MEKWAIIMAIAIPVSVAAVVAYRVRCRAVFWGAIIGTAVGIALRPLQNARYDDPVDELTDLTLSALTASSICALAGMVTGWIAVRVVRRDKSNRESTASEPHL